MRSRVALSALRAAITNSKSQDGEIMRWLKLGVLLDFLSSLVVFFWAAILIDEFYHDRRRSVVLHDADTEV